MIEGALGNSGKVKDFLYTRAVVPDLVDALKADLDQVLAGSPHRHISKDWSIQTVSRIFRGDAYLIAPMVSPRTSWRETIRLKMMTGRTIRVPVAIIWPQGNS